MVIGKQVEFDIFEQWIKDAKKQYPPNKGWKIMWSKSKNGNKGGSKGYPDFMVFNNKTKELVFVELKAKTHGFHPFQKQTIRILMEAKKKKGEVVTYKKEGKKYAKHKSENVLTAETKGGWEGARKI